MVRPTVLLVEDETLVARQLQRVISRVGDVRCYQSASAALREADGPVDALIVDLGLPDISGLTFIERYDGLVGQRLPVMFITGARPDSELINGCARRGRLACKPDLVTPLLSFLGQLPMPLPASDGVETALQRLAAASPLTKRELEVARLTLEGRTRAEVAAQLCISVATVRTHVNRVLGKCNLSGTSTRRLALAVSEARHGADSAPRT